MKYGRFDTIEGNREVRLNQVVMDVRSTEEKIADWLCYPRNFTKVMVVFAFVCFLIPLLFPVWLFVMLAMADVYGKAAQYLPIRYPMWARTLDPGQLDAKDMPTPATGLIYFGVIDAKDPYERGKQVFASADDLTRHMLVLGTTGSGKSEFLKAMTFNVLCWSSGFFVGDAKADNRLPTDVYSQVRMFLRDYDFLVVNYLLGGLSPTQIAKMRERLSNGMQPTTAMDADTLVQMVNNMMVKAGGDSKTWQERGLNMFKGVARAVCYKRDEGELLLSLDLLRDYLGLTKIEDLYIEGWKLANDNNGIWPAPYLGIKSYLEVGLPGFKIDILLRQRGLLKEEAEEDPMAAVANIRPGAGGAGKPSKAMTQNSGVYDQHGYRSDQVYPALSLLVDTYGHIFKRRRPEVDMEDVVVNNRICVSLIPSLEKGSQEQESLGKLNLALLRVMMARALGMSVEGDVERNVDSKITAADTPFALFLDEFAYQFAEGIALTAAQARSLNFWLCALAQDLEKLTEGDRAAEAGAMMANQALKFFMKIIGSDKTHELAFKTLGEATVAVLADMERDTKGFMPVTRRGENIRFEKRPRIERQVLENFPQGFAAFAYRERAHVMRTFYVSGKDGVPRVRFPRINRFLQIPDIDPILFATCAIEKEPSEEKLQIDKIRRLLNGGVTPEYGKVVTSDIVQGIIAAAKGMNPQTPPMERGIVLYQAGIEALALAKKGESILGRGNTTSGGASGQQDKPKSATPVVPAGGVPSAAAPIAAASSQATSGSAAVVTGTTTAAPAVVNEAEPAAPAIDERSAAQKLEEFDPLMAIMNTTPPIVRKPKEEVFDAASPATPVSIPATGGALSPAAPMAESGKVADENDFSISGDMLSGEEVPLIMGGNEQSPAAPVSPDPALAAGATRATSPASQLAELQQVARGNVDPGIVSQMGPEVVGLRDASLNGLEALEMALGATAEEAREAAENTEKVVAQSLSILDSDKVSATSDDVELLFSQLSSVVTKS
jgi:intracellular multiplication protein IcmO